MMTVSEQLRRSESGFTLVELMVVVLIIGILVMVAFPVYSSAQGLARERTCQANLRTIDGAIEQWRADAVANDAAALEGEEPFDVLENAAGISTYRVSRTARRTDPHTRSKAAVRSATAQTALPTCTRCGEPARASLASRGSQGPLVWTGTWSGAKVAA